MLSYLALKLRFDKILGKSKIKINKISIELKQHSVVLWLVLNGFAFFSILSRNECYCSTFHLIRKVFSLLVSNEQSFSHSFGTLFGAQFTKKKYFCLLFSRHLNHIDFWTEQTFLLWLSSSSDSHMVR